MTPQAGRGVSRRARPATLAAALVFAAIMVAGWPTRSAEPPTPAAAEPAAPETASPAGAPARSQPAKAAAGETGLDAAADVEIERRFNELRRELLESRMKAVDWWLAAMAIALALFGVVAVFVGYVGFRRFREIEAEARGNVETARGHAETARSLVGEIEASRDKAAGLVEGMNAQAVSKAPNEADRAAASVQENPQASPIEQAIAAAIQLQRRGDIEGAIDKWRAVANVVGGTDNKDLEARAWFSVGYLLQEKNSDLGSAIAAYDKAIQSKPDMVEAYNNRGNAKNNLGRHEDAISDYNEAIRLKPDFAAAYCNRGVAKKNLDGREVAVADYDQAIRLKPDYAEAYYNRGITKGELGEHEDAISDYDQAIRLKPNMVEAYDNRGTEKRTLNRHNDAIVDYNEAIRLKPDYAEAYYGRGVSNIHMGRKDDARRDLETALSLARKASDETLADTVSRSLDELSGENGS